MAKKIANKDLFDDNIGVDLKNTLENMLALVKELKKEFQSVAKSSQNALKANKLNDPEDVKKFGEEKKKVNDTLKDLTKLEKEELKLIKKLMQVNTEQNKVNIGLKESIKDQNAEVRNSIKLDKAKDGSLKKLRLELARNKKEYIELSKAERENIDIGGKLKQAIQAQTSELKEQEEAIGITARNVGNYKESVKEALAETDIFSTALNANADVAGIAGKAAATLSAIQKTLKKIVKEETKEEVINTVVKEENKNATVKLSFAQRALNIVMGKGTKALKVFKTALAATGIGLIVLALGSLVALFTQTQSGVDSLGKKIRQVGAFISVLVGRLAQIGSGIIGLFSAMGSFLSGDFKEAANKASSSVNKLTSSFDGFGKAVADAVEETGKLVDLEIAFRKENRELQKSIELLTTESERLTAISDDATRSFKEREDAAESARKVQEKLGNASIKLAQTELDLLNKQLEIDKQGGRELTDIQLDEQLEAQKKLIEAEREALLISIDNEKTRRELVQDRLERDLDILIDGFDNQKTINEQLIADDKKTFAERQKLFEETTRLANQSFESQKAILAELSKAGIDVDELLGLDAVELNKRIRALEQSEIIEGRTLEVIRERRIVLQDLAVIEKELNELRLASEKRLQTAIANIRAENLEDEQASLEQLEILRFESRKLELEEEFKLLDKKEELNALIREEEIKHQEKLDDIAIGGVQKRNSKILKEIELQGIEQGKTNNEIADDLKMERIRQLEEEIQIRKEKGEESIDQELELAKLRKEVTAKANKEILDATDAFAQETAKFIDQLQQKKIDALDKEIEASQNVQNQLLKLAEAGQLEAGQSLADAQKREAELQAEKEKRLRAQKNTELGLAALGTFTANVAAGEKQPLAKTVGQITALLAFVSSLPAFEKGGLVEGDEKIVRINEKGEEFVVNHNSTKKYGTDMLNEINDGTFDPSKYMSDATYRNVVYSPSFQTDRLEKKMDSVKKAIENKPVPRWSVSEITGSILEEWESKHNLIRKHYKKQDKLW